MSNSVHFRSDTNIFKRGMIAVIQVFAIEKPAVHIAMLIPIFPENSTP